MQLDLDDQDDDDDNDQDIPGASAAARRLFAGGNVRDNNADHTARDADVVNSHRQSEMSEKSEKSRMSESENTDRRADARERDDGEQRRAESSARDASSSRDARSDIDGLGDRDDRRSVHSLESQASIDLTNTDLVRRQPGRRRACVISSNRTLTRPPLSAR